jgi:hypothetical protein
MEIHMNSFEIQHNNYLGLFKRSGEIDLDNTCDFLSLSKVQLAISLGLNVNQIQTDTRTLGIRNKIVVLAKAMESVAVLMKGDCDKARLWFMVPNPNLGGNSPRSLILKKRTPILFDFINATKMGL